MLTKKVGKRNYDLNILKKTQQTHVKKTCEKIQLNFFKYIAFIKKFCVIEINKKVYFVSVWFTFKTDVQNDFIPPKGSLAVNGGDKVVSQINELRTKYGKKFDVGRHSQIISPMQTRKRGSPSLISKKKILFYEFFFYLKLFVPFFFNNNKKKKDNVAKPLHLIIQKTDKIVLKGMDPGVDSYSAFLDNDKKSKTALEDILKEEGVDEIYCVGLAYDYCVGFTAIDGVNLGFKAFVIKDCSASVAPVLFLFIFICFICPFF
ncbi:Pyrazinamidase/nicotinamidase [Reticulomyxa filosa]|uniref:nicotinamidase n=1 Tax=Reticulomyxa filosa TaxID=46433 RepID=X6N727_RETFI|nr:Pyrazinamidase/nicotinamidase [Reticulomyxa filosa]|eukprot:ETO21112.1 Pyrazinamidase/nicotinamidase [Reticulomyxa filosa]